MCLNKNGAGIQSINECGGFCQKKGSLCFCGLKCRNRDGKDILKSIDDIPNYIRGKNEFSVNQTNQIDQTAFKILEEVEKVLY